MRKQLQALIAAVTLTTVSLAQDGRYSQYYNNPVYLNPALAGNGIEYIRVTGIYRTQWAGLGTPFTTQGIAVDKVVNRVGLGGFINRQGAGDNGIRTLNISGNLAYHYAFGGDKLHTLSAGLQVGLINKSFDPNKMTFDNQYDPDGGYDPTMSSGEIFATTSVTRPDINAGFMYQYGWGRSDVAFKPFAGISFSHLNRPNETFIIDNNKAPVKTSIYAGAGVRVNDAVSVTPSVMILRQDHFKENTFGAVLTYQLNNNNAIQFGVHDRLEDAIIAYAGYQLNQVILGMSYDANTSSVSKSGKGINAFEISLAWSPLPRKKKEPETDPMDERVDEMQLPVLQLELPIGVLPEMQMAVRTESAETKPAEALPVAEIKVKETPASPVSAAAPEVKVTKETPVAATPTVNAPAVQVIAETKAPAIVPPSKPLDSDHDGINDADDDCPFIKGALATRGCPDSDRDGIQDLKDKCPMEAGVASRNGCPEPAAPATQQQVLIRKFNNVLFEPGTSGLNTPDIFDIIERAIELMYRDPSATAILSGHTDNEGDAAVNMALSQARAEAVKKYMVKMGIDPSRITTVAYGENMPLENNKADEGRRLNRRVEINIVKN